MKGVDFISSFLYFEIMNKVIYAILIVVLCSCKSNSTAKENGNMSSDTSAVNKSILADSRNNKLKTLHDVSHSQIAPNTVHVKGTVLGVFKNASICGISYEATTKVRITAIIGSGSGIINMISSGQEITFGLMKGQSEIFDVLLKKHTKDQKITFVLTENLCMDMGKTVYVIDSFGVKN